MTSSSPVNGGDSAYQSVLDEAQQLMDDIDITLNSTGDDDHEGVAAASFTIDDDDDDDDVLLNAAAAPSESHPLAAGTVGTASNKHDDPLSQMAAAESPLRVDTGAAAASTAAMNNNNIYYTPTMPQYTLSQSPQHIADQQGFKQQAQRLGNDAQRMAASVLTMAQRAAHQVVAAPHNSASATTTMPQQYTMPSPAAAGNSSFMPPQQQQVHPELDKDQKLRLLQSAVTLLKGEEVIMFLNHLLHVSDSTGASFYYKGKGQVMSCAMTFYRIVVFGHDDESNGSSNNDNGEDTDTATLNDSDRDKSQMPPANWNPSCWPKAPGKLLMQIPLSSLERVDKSVFSTSGNMANNGNSNNTHPTASATSMSMMGLVLTGKDNQRVIRITTASFQDTMRAHQALQTYAFPGRRNLGYLFAFESRRQEVMTSMQQQQPAAVDSADASGQQAQVQQQQAPPSSSPVVTCEPTRARFTMSEFHRQLAPGKHPWMIYPTLNHQYQLCMSYPGMLLAGPATLNAESNLEAKRLLQQCAQFRSEYRLPVLTWSSGVDGASLWRASQPKVGLQGNRSSADEMLLKHILEASASANAMQHAPGSVPLLNGPQIQALTGNNLTVDGATLPCLKILDLRPRSAAMANRTGGYGYENTSNYPGTTLQFCGIDNIHKVRDAYQKLSAVCMSPATSDLNWNASLEDTKWPSMIRLILAAAWESAFWIHVYRYPVLLHCSHGWDRTSQVSALAQLMLDPFYRTREGFPTLVEKDFMSFGHPFHTRCAHGEGRGDSGNPLVTGAPSTDEGQISPIFIQFLDCVFQLVNQYPECFEFNTKYLLLMSEHVYSCRFGTFLCDTERERELVAGIRQRTHSLWDYLDSRQDVVNHTFHATQAGGVMLMPLPTLLRNVTLWSDRHCMHGAKPTTRWLPFGVGPPKSELETDQQGNLATAHEMQALILGAGPVVADSKSLEEAPKEIDNEGKVELP